MYWLILALSFRQKQSEIASLESQIRDQMDAVSRGRGVAGMGVGGPAARRSSLGGGPASSSSSSLLLEASELDSTCQICLKTKFADGVGHTCHYCAVRCCARCGGKVTLR